MKRTIGRYQGSAPGPLVMVFGAMHGNESAGVRAIETVFHMLEEEPRVNPGFEFYGTLVGFIGNLQAYSAGQRFMEKDLNRQWTVEHVQRILQKDPAVLHGEDRELAELHAILCEEIRRLLPEVVVLLDLHTTSAEGGIFCIPGDDDSSLKLAKGLHAPVILGLLAGLEGTLLRYASENHFEINGYPKQTLGVAFEAGQHDDPLSVSRSVSALINCLHAAGSIHPQDVDGRHTDLLFRFSANLPKVARLRYIHHIRPGDAFAMRPGYLNFQAVAKGEHLADDATGPVYAPENGLILMPLYQPRGTDGFFIVSEEG